MKHYPYMVSKDYYFLYNYLMGFGSQFIIALSADNEHNNYVKMFRMRKNLNGGITIVDGRFYTKSCATAEELVKWCKEFNINWLVPSNSPQTKG